ncbi:MAG: hypothetical protein EB150_06830 [Nitrososphaeria archaeon]|nr:hypothetical protein [Nitrososphaeria archaeon]NDF29902.1 hypothetical protein [Nitrososphaeria archaeon]NDF35002.1 hypothetical protein [Nitrosopumilaceae archaeon]
MKLDQIDLAFLYLAITKNGKFNEQDLAGSDLAYLGVGRTLDKIAYLKENNLIGLDGVFFTITDAARQILWNKDEPLQTRILKILQIKSFEEQDIAKYLNESHDTIQQQIDESRKLGLLIFTTIKKDERIIKVCELTHDGQQILQIQSLDPTSQLLRTLDDIALKIQGSKIEESKIKSMLEKLRAISAELAQDQLVK